MIMWPLRVLKRVETDAVALQLRAAGAGCALACSYSSSAEFEAAVIRSKLDAGIYGPKRRRRFWLFAAGAGAVLAVLLTMW
jgi:hypothetical protein